MSKIPASLISKLRHSRDCACTCTRKQFSPTFKTHLENCTSKTPHHLPEKVFLIVSRAFFRLLPGKRSITAKPLPPVGESTGAPRSREAPPASGVKAANVISQSTRIIGGRGAAEFDRQRKISAATGGGIVNNAPRFSGFVISGFLRSPWAFFTESACGLGLSSVCASQRLGE